MGLKVRPHPFLTTALDEGEQQASNPGCFTSPRSSLELTDQKAGWAPELVCILQTNLLH